MVLRPTQGDEKRLVPATTLYGIVTLSLSSRPERSGAEGPAVPRTHRGEVFRPERSAVERPAVSSTITESERKQFPAHFPSKAPYNDAIAEASSRCKAAYFVIPTMVNTF